MKDKQAIGRAVYMLRVAAEYIREHYPDANIVYDEASCDGHCVADDCETAAEQLEPENDWRKV